MNLNNIVYALLVMIGILFFAGCMKKAMDPTQVDFEQAAVLISQNSENPGFVVLDVRTPEEYNLGHLQKAVNIDFYAKDFKDKLLALDRNKTYFLYCHSGNRSGQALDIMKAADFKKLSHLKNGIKSWDENKYPLIK